MKEKCEYCGVEFDPNEKNHYKTDDNGEITSCYGVRWVK